MTYAHVIPSSTRQAIVTRFIGPTDHRDPRVKATAAAGSVTVVWDDALNVAENHARAAEAFAAKFEWTGEMAHGVMADGSHVFAFTDR